MTHESLIEVTNPASSNHERLISDTNSSNANYDRVYEYTDIDKTTNLLGGVTVEINDKTSIDGVFSMVSEKVM